MLFEYVDMYMHAFYWSVDMSMLLNIYYNINMDYAYKFTDY